MVKYTQQRPQGNTFGYQQKSGECNLPSTKEVPLIIMLLDKCLTLPWLILWGCSPHFLWFALPYVEDLPRADNQPDALNSYQLEIALYLHLFLNSTTQLYSFGADCNSCSFFLPFLLWSVWFNFHRFAIKDVLVIYNLIHDRRGSISHKPKSPRLALP